MGSEREENWKKGGQGRGGGKEVGRGEMGEEEEWKGRESEKVRGW